MAAFAAAAVAAAPKSSPLVEYLCRCPPSLPQPILSWRSALRAHIGSWRQGQGAHCLPEADSGIPTLRGQPLWSSEAFYQGYQLCPTFSGTQLWPTYSNKNLGSR